MNFDKAYSFLIQKMETGLPSYLTYHNAEHTKKVVNAAEHLAREENVTGDDLILLKTAALFHDAGFLLDHQDHESHSVQLARKHLAEFDYTPAEIEKVCTLIMATRMPQTPVDKLSELLCDADLLYLGGKSYTETAEQLFREMKRFGTIKTKEEWLIRQAEFLSSHHYHTQAAIREREEHKRANLKELRQRIETEFSQKKSEKSSEILKDALLMLFGVAIAGYALKGFLVPNRFFDGGITGISLLVHEIYHFNLGWVILVLNLPFIITSWYTVGKRFALGTLAAVGLLGIWLMVLPDVAATSDKLLISVFGGVFLGIGIGLVMRAGAALDGIEVLALYTLKRTSFTITEIILGINILIFFVAGFKFGLETALYSVLTYFAASLSIDYVVEGLQAFTGVTIISGKSEVIKYQLVNKLGRGITIYKGERGFLPGKFEVSAECDIIFTVITRLELRKLKNLVFEVDPKAFVFASTIREASGGVLKRKLLH